MNPSPPTLNGGRYRLEARLGMGGQAAVYRVFDTRLGVRRAAKIMLPKFAEISVLRARFDQEARAMASIDHPNVVRVLDVATAGALPYLIMELVTGGSLLGWLEQHGVMPPRLACECVRQAALGAAAAHAMNVVHRDIKPHNVLVSSAGVCKLTDFGIARVGDSGATVTGSVMGTYGYMAPEQSRDATDVDVRSDVYSLGMTLFALTTGLDPVERLGGSALERLPLGLRDLVAKATAWDRAERHRDVLDLLVQLDRVVSELPPDPIGPPLLGPESTGTPLTAGDLANVAGADRPRGPPSRPPAPVVGEPVVRVPTLLAQPQATPPAPPVQSHVLPYQIPKREAPPDGQRPDWLADTPSAAGVRGFEVSLDEESRRATLEARQARQAHQEPQGSRDGRLRSVEGGDAIAGGGRSSVFADLFARPWWLLPLGLLALVGGAVPYLQTRSLDLAVQETRVARQNLHHVLQLDHGGLEAVLDLGGDRRTLEAMYFAAVETREEPERTRAVGRFLDALDSELALHGAPGMPQYDAAKARVDTLKRAYQEYRSEEEAFRQQAASPRGCLAVGVDDP